MHQNKTSKLKLIFVDNELVKQGSEKCVLVMEQELLLFQST
jgi:hypothetical protein